MNAEPLPLFPTQQPPHLHTMPVMMDAITNDAPWYTKPREANIELQCVYNVYKCLRRFPVV